jgi:osmotically-inducible protein OsmY
MEIGNACSYCGSRVPSNISALPNCLSDSSYARIGAALMPRKSAQADNLIQFSQEPIMISSLPTSFGDDVRIPFAQARLSRSFRAASAACMTGILLLAAGCDKYTDSGQTVGQKLDGAIDKTNAKVAAVGDSVGKRVDQVSSAVAGTGESISLSTGATLNKAGDAVSNKVEQVGTIVDDSAITASIKADLLKDPGLSALGIEVNTVKGEVTLKGDVSTEIRKQRAEGIASHIVGVTKVNNLLNVKGS